MMYGSWDTKHVWTVFSDILEHLLHFCETNNPKNQNFEKERKKTPGDIITLHVCTINNNHMVYGYI